MKKIIVAVFIIAFSFANAQVYKGKDDKKFQIGANMQKWGTGITATFDYGIGENMSCGLAATYLLGVKDILVDSAKFGDKADLKARFNANLGNVINIDPKLDVYPGLDLGLRNFGAHLGARYFFTDGFGVFTEAGFPLAKYKTSPEGYDVLNNQFAFQLGAAFNF